MYLVDEKQYEILQKVAAIARTVTETSYVPEAINKLSDTLVELDATGYKGVEDSEFDLDAAVQGSNYLDRMSRP